MESPKKFKNPLFLDIETVSCVPRYEDLDERMQALWLRKAKTLGAEGEEAQKDLFSERAAIYAEFGKVIVISVGYVAQEGADEVLYVKGLSSHDEKELLYAFKEMILGFSQQGPLQLCAHNGKEFDFPYLCRRMTIHGISLPNTLDLQGKKPWEVAHIDTVDLWKFGDRKSYTSLDLLGAVLGVPSSKDAMKGSEVGHYYYEKKDMASIQKYCDKDVIALAQIYRKLQFQSPIPTEKIRLLTE